MQMNWLTNQNPRRRKCTEFITAAAVHETAFLLLPLLIQGTGRWMVILLAVFPVICFAGALLYGLTAGFQWLYPLMIAALFFPVILIYLNSSAYIYMLLYGITALAGNLVGGLIRLGVLKKAENKPK